MRKKAAMPETLAHCRAGKRAAGAGGGTEVPLRRKRRLNALTKGGGRATEIERSGTSNRLNLQPAARWCVLLLTRSASTFPPRILPGSHALAAFIPFCWRQNALRLRENASQAVFARYLNVTTGLVSHWERVEKRPRGASLKLLTLVAKNGLGAVA